MRNISRDYIMLGIVEPYYILKESLKKSLDK